MLSGIGPASELRKLGISVRHDSTDIGSNLQEHPLAGLSFAVNRTDTLKAADTFGQLLRWLLFRDGLLSSNGIEAMAFTSVLDFEGPDLELLFANLEWRNQGLEAPQTHAYTIGAGVVAPRSRGRLSLRSADPRNPPQIDFGLLSDPDGADLKVMLAGLRLARRIAVTPPLADETLGELSETRSAQSDEELTSLIRDRLQTIYHPTSTCRMGSDSAAPVDPRLKLRGCESLWVVDASVMPTVPRGYPNAVVAMIAKRAAGWIAKQPQAEGLSVAA